MPRIVVKLLLMCLLVPTLIVPTAALGRWSSVGLSAHTPWKRHPLKRCRPRAIAQAAAVSSLSKRSRSEPLGEASAVRRGLDEPKAARRLATTALGADGGGSGRQAPLRC